MVQQNVNLTIRLYVRNIHKVDNMKHPTRQKSGVLPPSSAILKSPNTNGYNINSDGATLFQQGYMERKKPRPIRDLRREYENGIA